jgi:ankyrin repeat protein
VLTLQSDDPLAIEVCHVIRSGDVERLQRLLAANPALIDARITPAGCTDGSRRTLLHIATDWPGRLPNVAATIGALVDAGADVNARFSGRHTETALHWAASGDDLEALDALLDAGADIEADGAVIAGGTPLADAVAFGQWQAARRLIERGAQASLWEATALGLMATVEEHFARDPAPTPADITNAFWCACHGGQLAAAQHLLERGADLNWVGHDGLTPLDAASRSGADEVVAWLRGHAAGSARITEGGGDGHPWGWSA